MAGAVRDGFALLVFSYILYLREVAPSPDEGSEKPWILALGLSGPFVWPRPNKSATPHLKPQPTFLPALGLWPARGQNKTHSTGFEGEGPEKQRRLRTGGVPPLRTSSQGFSNSSGRFRLTAQRFPFGLFFSLFQLPYPRNVQIDIELYSLRQMQVQ